MFAGIWPWAAATCAKIDLSISSSGATLKAFYLRENGIFGAICRRCAHMACRDICSSSTSGWGRVADIRSKSARRRTESHLNSAG